MFNFYVVLASLEKDTDAGNATTCRRKLKAPSSQSKSKKMKDLPITWVSRKSRLKNSDRKRKNTSSLDQPTPWNTVPLNSATDDGPCNQEEMKLKKNWKKHSNQNCWNFARLELRSQVQTCSTFMYFWLIMTWSLTLSVVPRAGATSKYHH